MITFTPEVSRTSTTNGHRHDEGVREGCLGPTVSSEPLFTAAVHAHVPLRSLLPEYHLMEAYHGFRDDDSSLRWLADRTAESRSAAATATGLHVQHLLPRD